jgi:hypothetical protein
MPTYAGQRPRQGWSGLLGFTQDTFRRVPGILQNAAMAGMETYQEAKPRVEQSRDAFLNRVSLLDPGVRDRLTAGGIGPDWRTDAAFQRMRQSQVGYQPPREMERVQQAAADPTLQRAQRVVDDKAVFRRIWDEYLQQPGVEGGGVVHQIEGDPGGVTNWGIAQNYNRDVDVTKLTEDDAVNLAYQRYWVPYGLSAIAREDPAKATVLLDGYYNIGSPGGNMKPILEASGGTTEGLLREMRRYRETHKRHGLRQYGGNEAYINRQNILERYVRQPPRRKG